MAKKNNPVVKPFLKWAGGKRQLLPEIRKYVPKYVTYYEPFLGAGAVLLELQPKKAVVNDYNEQLMLTYRTIRDSVEQVVAELLAHAQADSPEHYYAVRRLDRDPVAFLSLPAVQKAARLIYLNKTCYNGLYRVNSQGLFNVPYGRYKNPCICEEMVLRAVSNYLQEPGVQMLRGDFADAVKTAKRGDFVYFDPPYHSPDSTNFTGYQAGGFDDAEQERLCEVIDRLTARGVKCILSNSDTRFIRKLYEDRYRIETVQASRPINNDANGRGKVDELLILNW